MFCMRIISGKFGSRQLTGTPPPGLRPTSDKLRETIFNILGPRIEDAIFLDACAGMGGIGIEAISRGAQFVHFVDSSRKACEIIRKNLSTLAVQSGFQIHPVELRRALQQFEKDGTAIEFILWNCSALSRTSNANASSSTSRFWILRTIAKTCTLWHWNSLAPALC